VGLLTSLDVMRALPWAYIRRLPRSNAWIGILTATVTLSLPLALLGIALRGEAGFDVAGFAFLLSLIGLLSSGARSLAQRRRIRRR